jgi:hypothetical protein
VALKLISGGADPAPERGRYADPQTHLDRLPAALTRAEEQAYVQRVLQRQVDAGATLLVPPYHCGGDPAEPLRLLDLRLARTAVRAFAAARLAEAGRELHAAIMVEARTLADPLARIGLVSAYGGLDVAGYIVRVVAADEQSLEPAAEFLFGLEARTQRPVVAQDFDLEHPAVERAAARIRRRAVRDNLA